MNKDTPSSSRPVKAPPSPEPCHEQITLPPGHEIFKGHFDEFPIVAGVHQIDWVTAALSRYHGQAVTVTAIPRAKFTAMIRPGAALTLTVTPECQEGQWRAKWRLMAEGSNPGQKFSEGRLEYAL